MEELAKEVIVQAGIEVAKECYKDALSPAMKVVGDIIALVPRTARTLLSPIDLLNTYSESNTQKFKEKVTPKVNNIPLANRERPCLSLLVAILQQVSTCIDNDDIRDMYANLLARAMNKETKNEVHQCFVEIIKQLSPDEALFLQFLYEQNLYNDFIAIVFVVSPHLVLDRYSDYFEKAGCAYPQKARFYFDNLERLNLLTFGSEVGRSWTGKHVPYHDILESTKTVQNALKVVEQECIEQNTTFKKETCMYKDVYEVTALGKQFLNICIKE